MFDSVFLILLLIGLLLILVFLLRFGFRHPGKMSLLLIPALVISPTITSTLPPPLASTRFTDVLILVLLFITAHNVFWNRKNIKSIHSLQPFRLLSFCFLATVLSCLFSNFYAESFLGAPWVPDAYFSALRPFQSLIIVCVASFAFQVERTVTRLFAPVVAICAFVASIIGIMQYYNMPGVRSILDQFYPQFFYDVSQFQESNMRITSTFDGSANILAAFLVFAITVILSDFFYTKRYRLLYILCILVNTYALILTDSRTQLLAASCVAIVFILFSKRWLLIPLALIIYGYIIFMPEISQTRWSQIQIGSNLTQTEFSGGAGLRWYKIKTLGYKVLELSPIFGLGGSKYFGSTSDVGYLRIMIDSGFVGMVIYLFQMGFMMQTGYRIYRCSSVPHEKALGFAFFGCIIAVMVGGIGTRVVEMPRVNEFVWLFTGLIYLISVSPPRSQPRIFTEYPKVLNHECR